MPTNMTFQELQAQRASAAQDAFVRYEFGGSVTDTENWRDTETLDWIRVCYVESAEAAASLIFHVRFNPGEAVPVEVFCLDLATGNEFGVLPPTAGEMAEALGFSTEGEMLAHGVWLEQRKTHQAQVSEAVAKAAGGPVVDIRAVEFCQ
ncbi:hypothetical protein [Pseudomonas sp. 2FE]|uniref:hypothetical protein n=1 Tax=Pseudomonas sp. 2FE TaxID=2502190 RepID=UPI0010F6F93C|nr:hypothetical protein [Pseudomonas sp. 2FE]